jgi:hypothetical protein
LFFQQNGKFLAKENHMDDHILQGERRGKKIIGKKNSKGKKMQKTIRQEKTKDKTNPPWKKNK